MKYRGIKIPEEIIIVEKHNGQGYVVLPGGNLESALSWAKYTDNKWIDGKWTTIAEYEGTVHTYKNGEFTISLYDSADGSSQGGKLSFWDCTIHAKDGKDYIIGINADILFNLMMNSTIINGDIQGNVWLGKEKNNTGVYTEDMEDFKQARSEDKVRTTAKTTDYKPLQVVGTLKDSELYLGEYPKYFELSDLEDYYKTPTITFLKKPKKAYVYMDLWGYDLEKHGKYQLSWLEIRKNKVQRLIKDEVIEYLGTPDEIILAINEDREADALDKYAVRSVERSNAYKHILKMQIGLEPLDLQKLTDYVSLTNTFKINNVNIIQE